jgi:hypothetical protein
MAEEKATASRRFSSLVLVVIFIVLAFSLVALYQAWVAIESGDLSAGYYLLIGFAGLALSTYMLLQTRRRVQRFTLETAPVTTTIVCPKCGLKNVRDFERGDYILKELGPCSKCDGTMLISAIFRELPEKKKKEEKVFT